MGTYSDDDGSSSKLVEGYFVQYIGWSPTGGQTTTAGCMYLRSAFYHKTLRDSSYRVYLPISDPPRIKADFNPYEGKASIRMTDSLVRVVFDGKTAVQFDLITANQLKDIFARQHYSSDRNRSSVSGPQQVGFGGIVSIDYSNHYDPESVYINYDNVSLSSLSMMPSLTEPLSSITWRPNAKKFVIYTEDQYQAELDAGDSPEHARLMAMLSAQNIHLIILGTDHNKEESTMLLNRIRITPMVERSRNVERSIWIGR